MRAITTALVVTVCVVVLGALIWTRTSSGSGSTAAGARSAVIHGGGASFPDAFYQAANTEFNEIVGYEAVSYSKSGSRDGRAQLAAGTLDLAGSDSLPGPDEDLPDGLMVIPVVAAPITVAFNLGTIDELSFSPSTLASIFQGDIDRWDDRQIVADNPGVALPSDPIHAVHRSDGSGTTLNFTRFLSQAAPRVWTLGSGDEIGWPADTLGGEKNSGVAELIATTAGSIGYVDLGDAAKVQLRLARVGNPSGEFVAPTADATRTAFSTVDVADDGTFDLLNSPASGAYPITAPTWLFVSIHQRAEMADLLANYLEYLLGPAQGLALEVGFVPLPEALAMDAVEQVRRIR